MFRDRELHVGNLRAEADYVRAHEAIYFAFESKSGRAFASTGVATKPTLGRWSI